MEYITANGVEYACKAVVTGVGNISFSMEGQAVADIEKAFRPVTELTVSGGDGEVYGTYENLSFESATVYEDGRVMVTMHMKSATESAHRKNAGRQWKSKRQRNRITKETDTPTDILCMIHGFALAAESTTRLIMIITITARIAVRN